MAWIIGGSELTIRETEELETIIKWHELDGYQLDLELIEFTELWDNIIDVYVDEALVGRVYHIDDIGALVDSHFEERVDS